MKSIRILLLLLILDLTAMGQTIRGSYFMDCPITNMKALNKLEYMDSLSYYYAQKSRCAFDPQYFPYVCFSNKELEERKSLVSIPRRAARIYYTISPDLKTIYLLGIAQNHMIQIQYDSMSKSKYLFSGLPIGENEFKSEPKFFIPLSFYSSFVAEKDIDYISQFAEKSLVENIACRQIFYDDTIASIRIGNPDQIASFNERRIYDLLYEIPVFSMPELNFNKRMNKVEIDRSKSCLSTLFSGDSSWIKNYIFYFEMTLKFKISRDTIKFGVGTTVSKVEFAYDFLGIHFEPCDRSMPEKVIWVKWADFIAKYDDPVFEQDINARLNEYLYNRLVLNK